MATQRFDISILLNVLSNGAENLELIEQAIKKLTKAGEAANRALSKDFFGPDITNAAIDRIEKVLRSFKKLEGIDIGGNKSFNDIVAKIQQIQQAADKGASFDVKTDIKELDIYLTRLEDIRRVSVLLDDKELFKNISATINDTKLLKDNLIQLEKISVDKNVAALKITFDEVNNKIKQTIKSAELLGSTGGGTTTLNNYIKELEQARDSLQFLTKEAQALGKSTVQIDTLIGKVTDKLKDLKSGKFSEVGIFKNLDDIVAKFNGLEEQARRGIKLDFVIEKAQLDNLEAKLIKIRNQAASVGDTELFKEAVTELANIKDAKAELERIAKIPLSRNVAELKFEIDEVTSRLKLLQKEGKNLIDTGADVTTVRRLITQIESAQQELIVLRDTSERLGRDTTQINIRIREGEETLKLLKNIDEAAVTIKRQEIDLKVKNKIELQDAITKLKELNKELDQAVADKDFKAIGRIKRQAAEVRAIQNQLAPRIQNLGSRQASEVFSGFTQGLGAAEARLKSFEQQAGTGLVRGFNNAGAAFRNFNRSVGGSSAGIRALAGTFRLIGTSAFVVGGELRTLGFAFSAIGSIIQNFGPLAVNLATHLGFVSTPVIALTGYIAALAIEGLALAGVLAAIAKTGLQFNDAFARTRNNVAGIVGLFFDVKEGGKSVGEGLDPTEAALKRLSATSQEVSKELRELTFQALTTEFTTEELFPAFNAVATSASKLAPDLQTLTVLTGGLARASSVAGVSAANLSSSITQLIAGTGRVTNPLQRFFNQIKDSEGIELTAKRIKALRSAGGTRLVDELLAVTEKFSVLGQEQAKTLSGSFSNIVDAFELFSGAATQKAYDTLRAGFERIKGLVTEQVQKTRIDAEGVLQNVTVGPKGKEKPLIVSQFTKPILELQKTLDNLFNKISQDFLGFLINVINYFITIGQYLVDNYANILTIYESLKLIVVQVLSILSNLVQIVTLSGSAGDSISQWISVLGVVNKLLFGIRLALIGINGILQGLATLGAFITRGLLIFLKGFATSIARTISIIPGFEAVGKAAIVSLSAAYDSAIKSVDDFGVASVRSFANTAAEAQKARNEYEEFNAAAKELKKTKEQKINDIVLSNETPLVVSEDSKTAFPVAGQKIENKFKKFDNTAKVNRLLDLGYTLDDISNIGGFDPTFVRKIIGQRENQLKLFKNKVFDTTDENVKGKKATKDRATSTLQEGKKLAEAQIALAKATEDAQLNIIKDRLNRQQSIIQAQLDANLIAQESATAKILVNKQKELKLDELARLNDIKRSNKRLSLLDDEFNEQEQLIKKQAKGPIELESKLRELKINRQVAELNNLGEIKRLEGEIVQLKERQLDLQLETLSAQLKSREELLANNTELKNSLAELGDEFNANTLAASQRKLVQDQLNTIRELETRIKSIKPLDFANLGIFGGIDEAATQKALLEQNLDLLKQQLDVKLKLSNIEFIQNTFQQRENELRLEEDKIQQDLAVGQLSEYEAAVKLRAERLKTVAALELANAKLKEQGDLNTKQQQIFEQNTLTIRKLSEELPDSGILDVTKTIGDSFTTLFEKIQEDVGNTKNAFADLAQSIIGSFRRLIAQRLSEALFDQLLKPNGKVGGFLEKLGLSRTTQVNKDAEALNRSQPNKSLDTTSEALNRTLPTAEELIAKLNNEFNEQTGVFKTEIQALGNIINQAITSLGINIPNTLSKAQEINITELKNINLGLANGNSTQLLALAELRAIRTLLSTTPSTSSSFDLGSIIPEEGFRHGGLVSQLKYFAAGGFNKGKDVVPAYLSNGEFIFTPEMVKLIGLPTLEYLNKFGKIPTFASGGLFENFGAGRSGPNSFGNLFNLFGGGASLINKPTPIVEKVAKAQKKKGGLRNILGNILSFAAPFLNLIPLVGPFLSLGAGAAGGALTGSTKGKAGGILGGIFGGLSNLGGFSGKGGFLGSLAGKVGSPTGQAGLSFFSGLLGNSGNTLGQIGAAGVKNGKFADLFKNFKGLGGSAFLKKILGFFDLFKFGKSFDLSSILGKKDGGLIPKLAEGGQPDLAKLLGLFGFISSISKLFGGSDQPEFNEEVIDDPDAARKNLFGSAYGRLVDSGFIPEFKYSAETLKKLQNQFNGIKNLVRVPKDSFLSKIFSILPSLAGLLNFGGKSPSKVGTASTSVKDAINAAGFASGGFVKGAGTGTSDSILSGLRPESFVLRAKSAGELKDSILASITDNIVGFNTGGLVEMLPELINNNNINTSANVSIHNYSDEESAMQAFLATPKGQKAVLNVLNKNRNKTSRIVGRGRG